jgi:hypothetical protein
MYVLVETCRLNEHRSARLALADILRRLPDHPHKRCAKLLPWNWKTAGTDFSARRLTQTWLEPSNKTAAVPNGCVPLSSSPHHLNHK